jgi:hypothetical protein
LASSCSDSAHQLCTAHIRDTHRLDTQVRKGHILKPSLNMSVFADPAAIPLLRATAAPIKAAPALSGLQRFLINFFATVRIIRGLTFMVWPALILSSFEIPRSGATFLLGALLGSRDLLLGGLLLTADDGPAASAVTPVLREVRRALLANLLSDAMDTIILIFAAACSWHWRNPVIEILAVAIMALLEHLTLFSMSDDDDHVDYTKGYQTMLRATEDKKNRLDSWLTELRMVEEQQRQQQAVAPPTATAPSNAD